jgi:alpha,alpha-trehalase
VLDIDASTPPTWLSRSAGPWRATGEQIRTDVLTHGVSKRGILRQHYETDALDASTLLAGSVEFLAHDDERLGNTVLAHL